MIECIISLCFWLSLPKESASVKRCSPCGLETDWQKASLNLSYRMLSLPIHLRAVGLPFEQTPKELLCKEQWGSQMVWQCLKAIKGYILYVPGTAVSLTKLFWRFLNKDKSRKMKGHLKYYIECNRIPVFCATSYCKKRIFEM